MEDTEVVVYQEQKQVSSEEQGQEHPRPGAPSDWLALEALVALQLELDPVNKKAQRAHARLKHKTCQRRRVHLEHRSAIIQGIPGFWVEVRSQSELSLAPGTLQRKGLSGIQFFSEKLSEFGGEVVMRYQASCSTPVQWYQGFERKAYSRRHHDSSVNFFNWFFDHNFSGSDWIAEIIIKDLWPNPLQYYVKRKAPPQEVLEGQETSFPVLKVNHIGYQKGKVGHSIISFPKSGIRIEMYEWTRAPKAKTRSSMRRPWWTLLLAIVGLPILSLLTFVIAMAVQQFLESLKSGFNNTQGHQP
ncbi:hypothetical protein MG293_020811 [Ovis ammon polii]|uniref:Uncharacterized protein n=1 Tax=Ovis ammon polii TaxID=230172 RepID=A0AAD4Y037_OVIAM|nr:hypothetical protein MG293_020811 [Ovis ammon polii]